MRALEARSQLATTGLGGRMITTSASSKSPRSGRGSSSSNGTCRAGASPDGSLPGAASVTSATSASERAIS